MSLNSWLSPNGGKLTRATSREFHVYSRGPSKTRRLIRGKLGSLVEIDSKVFNRGSEASLRNFYSKLYFSSPSRRKNTRRSISLAFNLYTCIDSCVVYLCANRCFRSVCLLSGRKTSARSTSTKRSLPLFPLLDVDNSFLLRNLYSNRFTIYPQRQRRKILENFRT